MSEELEGVGAEGSAGPTELATERATATGENGTSGAIRESAAIGGGSTDRESSEAGGEALRGRSEHHRNAGTDPDEDAFGEARPGLPHEGRVALATLMTQRFITREKHPLAWDNLLAFEPEIRERLDDLFLDLEIDTEHEVAFKRQITGDGVPVLLRRDRALSRDASLLLIHLRTEHAYHDALDEPLAVTRDQVADFLNRFGDTKTHDQVALERRVDASVRALELYNLLEATDETGDLLLVSPAVVPLVTPEVLTHLRDAYREASGRVLGVADGADADSNTDDTTDDGTTDADTADTEIRGVDSSVAVAHPDAAKHAADQDEEPSDD